MRWPFRRRRTHKELDPDEIFLDASNLPEFDQERLEGRLERPVERGAHIGLLSICGILFLILFAQAFSLEVLKGDAYAAQSERNRLRPEVLFASRGALTDRQGVMLAGNESTDEEFPIRSYRSPGFGALLGYVSYPKKDSSGNYYDTEIVGVAGAEEAFNTRLAGQNGRLLIEEDARGDVISSGSVIPVIDGESIALSIDARVQEALYGSIQELADRIPFQGGAGVIMDVETGELIALVSYPEYDPNVLSRGKPADVIASYDSDRRQPYLNRPVAGLYTPGSIVKPMIAAGAFSDGIISPYKEIVSTGSLVVPNPYDPSKPTIFNDWKAHGATDMRRAIAVSSDVYFYTIGGGFGGQKGLGIERLAEWYRLFGFESETGIELSGENSGFVPTPSWKEETYGDPWRIGNTFHTAIGQYSMQVTVLEAVRAVSAIANGGRLLDTTILKDNPIRGESILISHEGLEIAREGMRLAVTEGTAGGLNVYSYAEPAAKTGTAQLGANNEWYNSWVVGFFPYSAPKYAFAVVMERGPNTNSVGGVYVMARTFEALRQSAPEYFGLSPN